MPIFSFDFKIISISELLVVPAKSGFSLILSIELNHFTIFCISSALVILLSFIVIV